MNTARYQRLKHVPAYARRESRHVYPLTLQRGSLACSASFTSNTSPIYPLTRGGVYPRSTRRFR